MAPLFEEILRTVPPPEYDPEAPLQLLVTNLDYDDYVGRLALGRVFGGSLARGTEAVRCRGDEEPEPIKITRLYGWEGLARVEVEEAAAGDLVAVAGIEEVTIGDTVADAEDPRPLPPLQVDEPTLAMVFPGEHVAVGGA